MSTLNTWALLNAVLRLTLGLGLPNVAMVLGLFLPYSRWGGRVCISALGGRVCLGHGLPSVTMVLGMALPDSRWGGAEYERRCRDPRRGS